MWSQGPRLLPVTDAQLLCCVKVVDVSAHGTTVMVHTMPHCHMGAVVAALGKSSPVAGD